MGYEVTEAFVGDEWEVPPLADHAQYSSGNAADDRKSPRGPHHTVSTTQSKEHSRQGQRIEALANQPAKCEVARDSTRSCAGQRASGIQRGGNIGLRFVHRS